MLAWILGPRGVILSGTALISPARKLGLPLGLAHLAARDAMPARPARVPSRITPRGPSDNARGEGGLQELTEGERAGVPSAASPMLALPDARSVPSLLTAEDFAQFAKGLSAFYEGRFVEAIASFEPLREKDPGESAAQASSAAAAQSDRRNGARAAQF